MKNRDESSWSGEIRRHIRHILMLLVTLMTAGVGYEIWSYEKLQRIEREANNYHLAANAHYLGAMQELRKIQVHHGFQTPLQTGGSQDGAPSNPATERILDLTMHHVVRKKILKGLALEKKYADRGFSALSIKLENQLATIDSVLIQLQENHTTGSSSITRNFRGILVTLEQIVRLHSSSRDARLQAHRELGKQQYLIFFLVTLALVFLGSLVSRRSFRAINRLIQSQEKAEEKIRQQALYDGLTNLPNRFLALDRLAQLIHEAQRRDNKIAVLFIDLDYFKKVNDLLGHVSADKLLIEAARRISKSVRGGDLVGRLGGDEFIVVIGGVNSEDEVNAIAENLINHINQTFHIDGKELMLTASVGISLYPDDGCENLELIRKADSAMYHSKKLGRNTYSYFTESMNKGILRQLSLEEQIYGALDRGEFEVVYQQKVDIKKRRIVGAEALLRWHSEVLGPVSPDEFIPIAERTGLIVPIGEFVIAEALRATHQWQKNLIPDFEIAVNMSPRQFRDPDLVNMISRTLNESGVSSRYLELEITEGVLMSEYIHIDRALAELNQIGVVIAMDDFGTGYSSLSYLRDYPFGVIKIDRSFIRDVDSNSTSAQLNNAAIAMAHALNIIVVAEGVETQAQLAALEQLGCDIAQGYYFGRPVSVQKMTELLVARREKSLAGAIVDISDFQDSSAKKFLPRK